MAEGMFERLLKAMPDIANAVNQFESPTVQEQAFEALVRTLGLAEPPAAAPGAPAVPGMGSAASANGELNGDTGEADTKTETATPAARRRRRRYAPVVSAVGDINFRPQDKQSFRDFAAEKHLTSQFEKNVVAVYYLEQILKLPSISPGHVLAAYKECRWKEPTDLVNSLAKTASKTRWLDTSNSSAIRTTSSGRNQVEHDMPAAKT